MLPLPQSLDGHGAIREIDLGGLYDFDHIGNRRTFAKAGLRSFLNRFFQDVSA
jgi:hypothetical protein